jgi:hypothetical protein
MALPKQVEAQLKEVEEIEKQLRGETAEPTPEPSQDESQEAQPTPEATAPAEPKPEVKPETPAPQETPEETWQQKYRTLKGMYDAEVPRLHAQLKDLTKRLDTLQNAKPVPKPEPKAPTKLVTDEEVREFGADLIEVQRKVAKEVAQEFRDELDTLRAENQKLREQVTDTGTKVEESNFDQRLHRLVPDFADVNRDPKWIAWLNEVDPILRGPRLAIAQQAFNTGDAEAVAHYVGLFKASIASKAPASATTERKQEQELQIQPTKNTSSNAPASAKVYTNAQIEGMFKRVTELYTRGDSEKATKLEAEIDAAFRDGRVTA